MKRIYLILLVENNSINMRMQRTQGTIMNNFPSKSNAILKITVKQIHTKRIANQMKEEIVENFHVIKYVITVDDLSGSESISLTGS